MIWLSLLCSLLAAPADVSVEPGTRWVFEGNVAEMTRTRQLRAPGKEFTLTVWVQETESQPKLFWFIQEQGSGAWHWPERFGQVRLNDQWQTAEGNDPALLYDYGTDSSVVSIPIPFFRPEQDLAKEATWEAGRETFEVLTDSKIQDRKTWVIEVKNPFGFQRRLWLDQASPLVPRLERRVFMNMGTEYRLSMQLKTADQVAATEWAKLSAAFEKLLAVRELLQRPARTEEPELSKEQLALLQEAWPELKPQLSGDLLGPLAKAIEADLKQQTSREDSLAELVKQAEGREVPEFELEQLGGGSISSKDLKGQVTILHFWDYSDQQLEEPYGQVGYLDFLHGKREDVGIKLYGVAVNRAFNDATQRGAAERTVKRLQRFMRIGYPILLDDGKVLKAFGDPRAVDGSLPLFVVVNPAGKIIHYHVGHYEVDRDRGLVALDRVAMQALRNKSEQEE